MGFIWYIIIGIVAGFLAGKIMLWRRFWSYHKSIAWYSWRCVRRLGVCTFRPCGFRIDWKSDYFHSRCCSGVMDCFVVLEISMSSSILYNLLI